MMKCENCEKEHKGDYGSGRFCSQKCARGFATKKDREDINRKVSKTLKKGFKDGSHKGSTGRKHSKETRLKQGNSLKETHKRNKAKAQDSLPFEEWKKGWIYEFLYNEVGNKCEECGFEYTDLKTKKGPYEVHHVDGNNKNWKRDNLQILCLNCHWQTENWRFRGKEQSIDSIIKQLITRHKRGSLKSMNQYVLDKLNLNSVEEFIDKYC